MAGQTRRRFTEADKRAFRVWYRAKEDGRLRPGMPDTLSEYASVYHINRRTITEWASDYRKQGEAPITEELLREGMPSKEDELYDDVVSTFLASVHEEGFDAVMTMSMAKIAGEVALGNIESIKILWGTPLAKQWSARQDKLLELDFSELSDAELEDRLAEWLSSEALSRAAVAKGLSGDGD